jgi:hypothetical protein
MTKSHESIRFLCASVVMACGCSRAFAQVQSPPQGGSSASSIAKEKESPWMVVPVFSVGPKLGASAGVLAAYLHYFDEESQVSTFGVTGQYTSTDSAVLGAFAKTSYDKDGQRLFAGAFGGRIKNDYDDFLDSGQPLKSEDELNAYIARYLYRVQDDWFIGAQGVYGNYNIEGTNAIDDDFLNVLGLQGFESGALGAVAYHDSRDKESDPTLGWLLNANNLAYREWLGGSDDFDVVKLDYRGFWTHGDGNVFAVRQENK